MAAVLLSARAIVLRTAAPVVGITPFAKARAAAGRSAGMLACKGQCISFFTSRRCSGLAIEMSSCRRVSLLFALYVESKRRTLLRIDGMFSSFRYRPMCLLSLNGVI